MTSNLQLLAWRMMSHSIDRQLLICDLVNRDRKLYQAHSRKPGNAPVRFQPRKR